MRYCLKIANFWYPTSIWRPRWEWLHWNFRVGPPVRKLESWSYQLPSDEKCLMAYKFSRFDTVHTPTWQTDGRTVVYNWQPSPKPHPHHTNTTLFEKSCGVDSHHNVFSKSVVLVWFGRRLSVVCYRTDGHLTTAKTALCIASRGKFFHSFSPSLPSVFLPSLPYAPPHFIPFLPRTLPHL